MSNTRNYFRSVLCVLICVFSSRMVLMIHVLTTDRKTFQNTGAYLDDLYVVNCYELLLSFVCKLIFEDNQKYISSRIFENVPQNGPEYPHRNLAIARFLVTVVRKNIEGLLSWLISLSSSVPELTHHGLGRSLHVSSVYLQNQNLDLYIQFPAIFCFVSVSSFLLPLYFIFLRLTTWIIFLASWKLPTYPFPKPTLTLTFFLLPSFLSSRTFS